MKLSDAESWTMQAVKACDALIEKAPFFVLFGLDFGLIEFGRWYMEVGPASGLDHKQAREYATYRRAPTREFLARLVTRRMLDDALTDDPHDRLVLDAVEAGYNLGHNELMCHTSSYPARPDYLAQSLRERLVFLDVYRAATQKALDRVMNGQPAVDDPREEQK